MILPMLECPSCRQAISKEITDGTDRLPGLAHKASARRPSAAGRVMPVCSTADRRGPSVHGDRARSARVTLLLFRPLVGAKE
jgi:hypothetical protein